MVSGGAAARKIAAEVSTSPYTLSPGSSADFTRRAHSASLRMDGWMDGMGWMGWTEYQMGPSIFFILCGYIEKKT